MRTPRLPLCCTTPSKTKAVRRCSAESAIASAARSRISSTLAPMLMSRQSRRGARKEEYVNAIPHKSEKALLVSLADKVHNASAILSDYTLIGEELWSRFSGGREGTLWYYRALTDAFRDRAPRVLWQRLEDTVNALESRAAAI